MNSKSSEDTTTQDLRAMTNAPQPAVPLVNPDEFPAQLTRSSRPIWIKPIPKLVTIGIVLIPVFIVAAALLMGGGRFKQAQKAGLPIANSEGTPKPDAVPEELERLREENGKLKANAAIGNQNTLQNNQKNAGKQAEKLPKINAKATADNPVPSSQTASMNASPPIIDRVSPPRILAATDVQPQRIQPARLSANYPRSLESIDPMQQWQQLARLGSYGSSSRPEDSPSVEWSDSRNSAQATAAIAPPHAADVPTAQIAPTSAVPTEAVLTSDTTIAQHTELQNTHIDGRGSNPANSSEMPSEISTVSETRSNDSQLATQIPILKNEESAILGEQTQQASLIAGSISIGTLTTPLVLDHEKNNSNSKRLNSEQFTIALSQPLMNSMGQIAMPAGTQLLVQVDELSETGKVQLSATTAVWNEDGFKKELILPTEAIQIRGENGKPLIAQQLENRGKAVASMDAGQFALGAIRRSAALFTRSNSQIQTGNNTTVITDNNPTPNILAGALEGGTDALLDSITARNQEAIQDMEKQPTIRVIESGQPVQIFVNQSMLMPT